MDAAQPELNELAAAEASLAEQLRAMQEALAGSGRDLSSLATLKVSLSRLFISH